MVKITINSEKCKECGFCITACPIKNIRLSSNLNKKGYHYAEIIDVSKCTGCGLCYQMCPDLCIEIEK
ncbi:MAG: 4Fe-4S binding protein [Nanoarchaeota archaeon]|nr:4Fe-4S binding protein [Nanoarchaeota archaeon]MBU1004312.1 4Fe-4S binding protein [Nanoarchaeota archaeon]MBU1945470.1 4Fe-4S binding protein [Nanoarchaeota archaeon]